MSQDRKLVGAVHEESLEGCPLRYEKDGRSCPRVTKVLLFNNGVTRTQSGFCRGGEDDRNMIKTGEDWRGMCGFFCV